MRQAGSTGQALTRFSRPGSEGKAVPPAWLLVISQQVFLQGTSKVHQKQPFVRVWQPGTGDCKAWAYKLWTKKGRTDFANALRNEGLELAPEPTSGDTPCDVDGAFTAECGLTVGRHNAKEKVEVEMPEHMLHAAQKGVALPCILYRYDNGDCWEVGHPLAVVDKSAAGRKRKRPNDAVDLHGFFESNEPGNIVGESPSCRTFVKHDAVPCVR